MLDDSAFLPENVIRCKLKTFISFMIIPTIILIWGIIGGILCLWKGLNQTNMNDFFAFGLWIGVDLFLIAMGASAFFNSYLLYILRIEELKNIINVALIIGLICYSCIIPMLGIDIGQPLRGWFGLWHANVNSMLTEVMFCITIYTVVLSIEFIPIIIKNKKINKILILNIFAHHLHKIIILFVCIGTFLSFFHQGSLGGLFGVLYTRPFAYREGYVIWPSTFFLFILSAVANGPSFTTLIIMLTEKITKKKLTTYSIKMLMGKISGFLLILYMTLKTIDTFWWANYNLASTGLSLSNIYTNNLYGKWLLWTELGIFGWIPAVMLIFQKIRKRYILLALAMLLNCIGVLINRFVFNILTLAIPVLPFENFHYYSPSWQEWSISFGAIAYGIIFFSLAYRYLPLFPQEKFLNK